MEENKNINNETVNNEPSNTPNDNDTVVNEPNEPKLSVEEELVKMRVEYAKLKKAFDKSSSETASYKKQLRERQSADEIALQEKAERDAQQAAEIEQLRKENTVNKLAKSFLALGYSEDMAEKAANAQYENDTDLLFEIQRAENERRTKALREELLKSMPTAGISSNRGVAVTQAEFNKMNYARRLELKQSDPELFKKLNGI